MDKKYNFSYEPISVYACAVDLVRKFSAPGSIHIDLGCGYAAIARQIESSGIKYVGFDTNRESVEALKQNDIEAYELDLTQEQAVISTIRSLCERFSIVTISMLDVIEHLDYECGLLSWIKECFSSEQNFFLILSVPNSSHVDVSTKLFAGSYNYLDTGLLDKTHTVVYTEENLSRVTTRNGWRQVASNDYHLEFSEQFQTKSSIVLNRDSGIGHDFRKLKGILDPCCDVYQFVRAYAPDISCTQGRNIARDVVGVSISLIFKENVECQELTKLISDLSAIDERPEIELVIPEKRLAALELSCLEGSSLKIASYAESMLGEFIRTSINTRYWSLVTHPKDVCVSALCSLFEKFDGSRGSPLIELAGNDFPFVEGNQFELFLSLNTEASCRIAVPTDYVRQFHDLPFVVDSPEAWSGFVRRAALACGVKRINLDFSNGQVPSASRMDQFSGLTCVLADEKMRSYVLRSEAWASALLGELQSLASKNSELQTPKAALISRIDQLEGEVNKLECQLGDIIQSKSWKLTKPLRFFRRAVFRGVNISRAVVRKDRSELFAFARAIYLKVPGLRFVWSYYLYTKMRCMSCIQDKAFSHNNSASLKALSNNRFSEEFGFVAFNGLKDFPEIDVSVVAFNSSRWIRAFFESLISQDYPLSKIHFKIVDNGSADNTVTLFSDCLNVSGHKFASAEIIQQENLGFGLGHDRAIRKGSSEYCLIVNLDLEFLSDSIVKAVNAAVNDKGGSTASWEFRQIPYEHPKYYDPVTLETNWSSHACILLRRDAYLRCGGYDHAIFMYGEDVELSYRLRSFGFALKYLPSAAVLHHTYEQAGEVKPLQFVGSVLGNAYIRLRYGSFTDRVIAVMLYAALFVYPSPFAGAKKMLLRNIPKLVKSVPHFLKGKGPVTAKFPFRGYDYELIRDGAFWQSKPFDTSTEVPLVTVITRTYQGRGMFLKQAMQSVFNQTYQNIELLVAEDGGSSQLELVDSISKVAPSNVCVRFIGNEKIGRSGVGNAAMAAAQGQYYMFLDDDDLLFSDHVETLMQCLSSDRSLDAAYSLAFEVTTHVAEDKSSYVEELLFTPPVFRQVWDYSVMQRHNFIPIQSIIFKKELYQRWGGFDLALDQLEDWNLWLRYGYNGNFRYVEKTTSLFRTPAESSVRAERHALLHNAYDMAVQSANESIAKEVGNEK
ncbi:glycosyltransferase [Pseudomonas sp. H11T01]|uniref:glycosyltransferase n=1 Tax=Pseudomonas sp. H11T01 TaxID=3402749 RepID=UPI003AC5917C